MKKKMLLDIYDDITWENWRDDKGRYFNLCGVMYSKLECLKENLEASWAFEEDDKEEYLDTIQKAQAFIEAFSPEIKALEKSI